jgi:hypothetical protein
MDNDRSPARPVVPPVERGPTVEAPAWLPAAVIAALLYGGAVALGLVSAAAVNAQQVLSGEETSVSMLDVVSVAGRFQPTKYATNFAGHVYFWAFSHVDPSVDLFYGRDAKAFAMGLLAPLVYLTARRRLCCGRGPATLSAVVAVLLPGVSAFAWLATENGLEVLWGLAALFLATSRRATWVLAPVAAGLAVSVYGSGLAWAGAVVAVVVVRLLRSPRRSRDLLRVAASSVAGAGIVLFPLVWWRGGGVIVVGGAAQGAVSPGAAFSRLVGELAVRGDSYYYFTSAPALGSLFLAVVLGLSLIVAGVGRPQIWPWLLAAVLTVVVAAVSAGPPGVRRTVGLPVLCALALGVVVDMVVRRQKVVVLRAALLTAVAIVVVGPLAGQFLHDRAAWTRGRGDYAQPHDFAFPIVPGRTMPQEFADITAALNARRTTYAKVATQREGERTLATVLLLAARRGDDLTGLASPAEIAALVAEGPRCQHDCHPVAGRR